MMIVEDTSWNDIIVVSDMAEIYFHGQKELLTQSQF